MSVLTRRWIAIVLAIAVAISAGSPGNAADVEDVDADGFPGAGDPGAEPLSAGTGIPPGLMLIDRSHGEAIELFGITFILEKLYGWTVDEHFGPGTITPDLLAPYDVLLIGVNFSPGPGIVPFSDEEVAAILSFVASGRGLWAFHEYSADPTGINSLSTHFGVTFYDDIVLDPDAPDPVWPEITELAPHPITEGLDSYTYFAGPCLSAAEPAAILGRADDNASSANCPAGSFPPVLAVVENEAGGCAVFHGDITILTGYYGGLPEGLLVENMIRCLATAGPVSVETESFGTVKARYR